MTAGDREFFQEEIVTTWIEPEGGRERGPLGLTKAFTQVLLNPRTFFEEAVSPGDQAPGLVFGMTIVFVVTTTRFVFNPSAALALPASAPVRIGVTVALATLLIAPAALHGLSAIETIILIPIAPDRGGVSETVQIISYASAPCVFLGIPETLFTSLGLPAGSITFICGLWAFCLLVLGTSIVHTLSIHRAFVTALIPGILVYGSGFGWFAATIDLFPVTGEYMPWVGRTIHETSATFIVVGFDLLPTMLAV